MATIKYLNITLELFGGFLSLVIIFSLILTGFEKNELNRRYIRVLACNIIVLTSDAAAWFFKGNLDTFSRYAVHIANFCVFVFGYILLAFFVDYITCYLSSKTKITNISSRLIWGMCGIAIVLVIISQWNHMYYLIDENNMYRRQSWFWLSQVWAIFSMLIAVNLIYQARTSLSRRELISLASYIILPVAAMFIQIFVYGIALLYLATSISALCIYMGIQVELAKKFRERELELEKSRTEMMLSQIQPHFLFNSLTSICYLCRTDPVQAEQVVINFSNFLRGNIESLNTSGPIPFSQELTHLRHYLEVEKVRYKERLRISYDIQSDAFLLPSLTVQPIVENAVRHGIGKKHGGGTVAVSVRETERAFIIIVSDDGIGFDPAQKPNDGGTHIGLHNVQQRVRQQCDGDLEVTSVPGTGTAVTITIPKRP